MHRQLDHSFNANRSTLEINQPQGPTSSVRLILKECLASSSGRRSGGVEKAHIDVEAAFGSGSRGNRRAASDGYGTNDRELETTAAALGLATVVLKRRDA